ncbi:MAG: M24 family metallopeptidase [Candidatus Methylacidiphilales bacterium]
MVKHCPHSARLIYASSERSADLLYATGFRVPDAVVWLEDNGKTRLILNPLEIDRGRRQARVDQITAQDEIESAWRQEHRFSKTPPASQWLPYHLKSLNIEVVDVPADFPLEMAHALDADGINVRVLNPFFPQREIKSGKEIQAIIQAQRQAEAGLTRGTEILSSARISKQGILRWGGATLTSERLRFEIDQAVRRAGGEPAHTIVAGGEQACDPHEQGHGPLHAGELIILDIFPHDSSSGYFGDLTRTLLKGTPSPAQKKLVATVRRGQKKALDSIHAGVDGALLQDAIRLFFSGQGYPTEKREGRWTGFFHGLGHGVGLEIHESPRIAAGPLKENQVVTVEPGLYIPGLGGVRLEDLVVVGKDSCRNLTRAPFSWVIP